tara:strand:+ start:7950 stop:9155 length:1206 start_codon:yes stop_codon:yes gene_type:complete
MAYVLQTRETIEAKLQSYFGLAGFLNLTAGTPEHALWQILTDSIFELYSALEERYSDVLPLNASGSTLDLWADFFGSTRETAIFASDASLSNVFFSIAESSRAQVNGGEELTIAAGALVSAGGIKEYKTTVDVVIPADGSPPYAGFTSVQATSLGAFNNVEAGELGTHNLVEVYPDIEGLDLVEVSNKFAILSGSYPQTDSMVQANLQNLFGKNIGNNMVGMVNEIFNIPEVADVQILNAKRGTGTFSVFVDSVAPVVSLSLIQVIQELVDSVKAIGVTGYVEYPIYRSARIKFEVLPATGENTDTLLTELESDLIPEIVDRINNTSRGSALEVSSLLRIVLNNSKLLQASIAEFKVGDYAILEDKIINETAKSPVKQGAEWNHKWFSSDSLITFCTIKGE